MGSTAARAEPDLALTCKDPGTASEFTGLPGPILVGEQDVPEAEDCRMSS